MAVSTAAVRPSVGGAEVAVAVTCLVAGTIEVTVADGISAGCSKVGAAVLRQGIALAVDGSACGVAESGVPPGVGVDSAVMVTGEVLDVVVGCVGVELIGASLVCDKVPLS